MAKRPAPYQLWLQAQLEGATKEERYRRYIGLLAEHDHLQGELGPLHEPDDTSPRGIAEYRRAMDALVDLAHTITLLPLDQLLATIDRAEALGPVLHPTAYRTADLGSQRRLVDAAIALRRVLVQVAVVGG